jgi:hypothetical protein
MASSGGGSSRPPNQATPSGTITPFGSATPWEPDYNNVLPSSGWATVPGVEGTMNGNASATAARAAAAPSPAAASPWSNADAFAQQLMDWRKGAMANPLYAMQHAPTAQGPTQQLMLSLASGGARDRLAQLMPAYNAYGAGGMRR